MRAWRQMRAPLHAHLAGGSPLRLTRFAGGAAAAQSLIEFSEVTKKSKFGEKTVSITSQELARLRAAAAGAPAPSSAPAKPAPKAAPKPASRPSGEGLCWLRNHG